jgi:hypothetical protein
MQLVVTEDAMGIWAQLEGETPSEWDVLETLAAQGERTSGPGTEAIRRLRALAARLGYHLRVDRR